LHSKSEQLTGSEATVGPEPDQRRIAVIHRIGELTNLSGREKAHLLSFDAGERYIATGVGSYRVAGDRGLHDLAHDLFGFDDRCWSAPAGVQFGDPFPYREVIDLPDRHRLEPREDRRAEIRVVSCPGGRAKVHRRALPLDCPLSERDATQRWVDRVAASEIGLNAR
jgi:hypothetical protein